MFTPSRLALARKRRGISAIELARRADLTAQSISNFERGQSVPSDDALLRIADALQFPMQFFSRSDIDHVQIDQVSFRARSRIPAGARDATLSAATLAVELNAWIDVRFRLPAPSLPTLERHSPQEAAVYVRAKWGLDERAPAPNMVHLLESKGVRVFSLAPEFSEVDAFSFWDHGTPFVLLNTMKTGERGRFDAAHELGHLVLHGHNGCPDWDKDVERDANTFASNFLMPHLGVRIQLPANPTTDQIIRAKPHWRVAAMALAYRANDLGLFTEWNYRRCLIELAKLGFRTGEPRGIQREASQLLEKVFRGLREKNIPPSDAARDLGISTADLSMLVFGLMMVGVKGSGESSNERAHLTLVKTSTHVSNGATVRPSHHRPKRSSEEAIESRVDH